MRAAKLVHGQRSVQDLGNNSAVFVSSLGNEILIVNLQWLSNFPEYTTRRTTCHYTIHNAHATSVD